MARLVDEHARTHARVRTHTHTHTHSVVCGLVVSGIFLLENCVLISDQSSCLR